MIKHVSTLCQTCNGEAYFSCPDCQGDGEVLVGHGMPRSQICLTCGGFGEIHCPDCDNGMEPDTMLE